MHALEDIQKAGLAEGQRHAAQEAAKSEAFRLCQAEVADKTARLAELQSDVEYALVSVRAVVLDAVVLAGSGGARTVMSMSTQSIVSV